MAAHLDLLQDAGFRIEEFGEREFVVKGVPEWLGNADLEELFGELLDVMLDTGVRRSDQVQRGSLKEHGLSGLGKGDHDHANRRNTVPVERFG